MVTCYKFLFVCSRLLNRVLGMLACSRALRVYVLDVLGVLACSRAWRAFALTCLTYVLAIMCAWNAQHWRTRVFV